MIQYIARRLLVLPVVVLIVTGILFLIILQLPLEDRAQVYVPSVNPHLSASEYQELVRTIIERRGLDRPFFVQYWEWIRNLVTGEWGWSPTSREPVLQGLLRRAPASLEIALYAMGPAILLALLSGSLAAVRRNGPVDHGIRTVASVGWAFPPFILALILMNVLYAWLGWFPPERMSVSVSAIVHSDAFRSYTGLLTVDALLNLRLDILVDALRHLVLPALSLGLIEWALLTRIMRSSLLEVLRQDYITTARAKGLREERVITRHARRNALLPVISAAGAFTSLLITWLVVVELVFGYNGIGRWAVRAILAADLPVALGFAIFTSLIVVFASLIADLLYAVVDPRVRIQ